MRNMTGPEPDRLELTSDADQHAVGDWEKIAAAVLRKAGRLTDADPDSLVWEKLARATLDGINVAPLGAPSETPAVRGPVPARPETGWDIRPQHSGPDPKSANQAALVDLENGATSLWLTLGEGLTPSDLETVLEGVYVDLAPVVLDAPADPVVAAVAYVALLRDREVTPAAGTNLGADPIGAAVRAGRHTDRDQLQPDRMTSGLVDVAVLARDVGCLGVVVDATAVHDLGASDAQELGYSLAVGATYLRVLVASGLSVDEALGLVEFRYAATAEQFPTIAKLRAARRLWARVAELSSASESARVQRQHAVTSRPMMSKYDPWVNMLRVTVAAFAAGVAGADAVTVLPFDSALGVPDAFGRRIARNTSSLLISESHVAKVADPAGGSYAVEKLTDDLAQAGWTEFGRIERSGGIAAALADGSLAGRIEEIVARRDTEIARRKRPLTGVSEFPNLGEALPTRAAAPSADTVRRYGAPFEALRDEPAETPVFLATMGTVAAHTARATFAANLFAAGGIAVAVAGATADVAAVVAAYSGQPVVCPVVCLAGTDAAYAEWGGDLIAALRDAGAQHIILAGKPGEKTVAADLLDDSCAVGVDALDFLTRTREHLS